MTGYRDDMAEGIGTQSASPPWITNGTFDGFFIHFFIFGLLAIALLTGGIVILDPTLFYPVLVIDLWFLGYHHVIATFTRLCFDRQSLRDNRFLVLGLTPIIAGATLLVAWQVGIWAIVSVYFYWQWWHYARQSWGISRVFRAKDPSSLYDEGWLGQAIFHAVPVYGILSRSHEQHATFLGFDLWSVPVPGEVVTVAGYVTAGLLAFWAARRMMAAAQGRLAPLHTLYMLTHIVIFAAAYVLVSDVTYGWLMINIWHNAQYILFVWMYNTRRFEGGIDPEARFLSYISQPGRLWLYLVTCVTITGAVYWGVLRAIDWIFFAGLSATLVLYQIVNFHHYVVDSVIWKVRKPAMRQTLGLPG